MEICQRHRHKCQRFNFKFGTVCGNPVKSGKVDTDGDGLCDHWELHGIDYNGDGWRFLPLNSMRADPRRKDIFVEADWMTRRQAEMNICGRWSTLLMWLRCLPSSRGNERHYAAFGGGDSGGYLDEAVLHVGINLFEKRGPWCL